ncbi:MAG: arginine deiminase-related protein [Pseudomonadota bacterium]
MTSPTFLMTDPAHYEVSYQINPWMRPDAWSADPAANLRAASAGWRALKAALERAGGVVHPMSGVDGLPDMVFPANAAVVLDRKALVARFRKPERSGEERHFLAAFADLEARGVIDAFAQIEGCFQEGAGDAIWDAGRRLFWVGSGPRSSPESVRAIADYFGQATVHLPLASDRYYHLDTCFCPLSGGEILYYPPALTEGARALLKEHASPDQLIEATDEDAGAFCVNAVCIGRTVIMAQPPAALRARLAERGYDVVPVDLGPFMLSGGAAYCMTLRLDLQSSPVASVEARPAALVA